MAGYNGYAMSNNAVEAYSNGEKPFSKWTKSELLDNLTEEKAEICKKLTCAELRSLLLKHSSWHHSSKFYNRVDFYEINEDKISEITREKVEKIINNREPRKIIEKITAEEPTYITAYVQYSEWIGTRSHPEKITTNDCVFFRKNDKMIKCPKAETRNKRFSSVKVIYQIEQKNEYATKEMLQAKYKIKEI